MEKCEGEHEPLNYIQALGISKDQRALPAIRRLFEKCKEEVEKEKTTGAPGDAIFGPIPYHAYFVLCEALLKITGATEFDDAIRKYLDHQNEQVRLWAERALGIEGPATAKRRAEYLKRLGKE